MRAANLCVAVAVLVVLAASAHAQGWQFSQPSWTLDDWGWTGRGGAGAIEGGNGVQCHALAHADPGVGSEESVATATCHGTISVTKGPCAPPSVNTTGSAYGTVSWSLECWALAGDPPDPNDPLPPPPSLAGSGATGEHEATIVAPGTGGTRHVEHEALVGCIYPLPPPPLPPCADFNPGDLWQVTALSTFTENGNVKVYLYVRAHAFAYAIGLAGADAEAGEAAAPVKSVCGQFQVHQGW